MAPKTNFNLGIKTIKFAKMPEENSSINPKFSVIMNCLNGSKYLKQSINSLLDQIPKLV